LMIFGYEYAFGVGHGCLGLHFIRAGRGRPQPA
jgi:hypothetical protein